MTNNEYVLGLDTSNYTTSVALIDRYYKVVEDRRKTIIVKEGMKGIRQSEALFQHMDNLPDLLKDILRKYGRNLAAVCASAKPRPVEGSYMPVFKSGLNYGHIISDSLSIPLHLTSHQEGHIEAGLYGQKNLLKSDSRSREGLAVFHLSGGTTEILYQNKIIGGSNDISIGQLLDRIGVNGGLTFPAGEELDRMACEALALAGNYAGLRKKALKNFKYISKDGLNINLSGIDTQIKRMITAETYRLRDLSSSVFYLIAECLKRLTVDIKKQYNVKSVLFVGGVSASKFIKDYLSSEFKHEKVNLYFAQTSLSADNAVGAAIIGGRSQWL